ncbi:MAG TPA: MarR family transcriptional regulator [Woeseiaceae bacterium]
MTDHPTPREAFASELGRLSRRWRTVLDERLRHTGLTQARWSTLLLLSRADADITQRELALQAGIEGPTLVRLLDALERQGLIERVPAEGDRRAKHVRLAPGAHAVLAEISEIATALRREILADVAPEDLATCLRVFRRIGARLGAC